jgi:hypothetical protein
MLQGSTLRLTNARYLNDTDEYTLFMRRFWETVGKDADEAKADAGYAKATPFCFCLSEHGDSLPQWRAYADDMKGVAIGFDPRQVPFEHNTFPINYDEHNASSYAQQIHQTSQSKDQIFANLMHVFEVAALFKNESFHPEQEWRFCLKANHAKSPEDEMNFRQNGSRIAPFIELKCPDLLPLQEIVLGPRASFDHDDLVALQWLLRSNGYDPNSIEITKSESTAI